jgi:hypothetical protein
MKLQLDVEKGVYRYLCPIFQLRGGYQVFRSELKKTPLPSHLSKGQAQLEIRFNYEKHNPVDISFSLIPHYHNLVPREFGERLREWLPRLESLGWHMISHKGGVRKGKASFA